MFGEHFARFYVCLYPVNLVILLQRTGARVYIYSSAQR